MFEKEAEEYVDLSGNRNYTERAFKDGAEFGYNKAKEEQGDKIESSYREGVAFGKDKANEWHFDEAPDNENDILCQIAKDESVVGYYSESKKRYYTIDGQSIEVIAWKEIVLPELKEIK